MVDESTQRILQVELNTIASSFACLSSRVSRLHRHLLSNGNTLRLVQQLEERFANITSDDVKSKLPVNDADKVIPKAMAKAHKVYDQRRTEKSKSLFVAFVVQDNERNYVDQRHLEYELMQTYGVPSIRITLGEMQQRGKIDSATSALIVDDVMEISLCYYRSGYTPNDYPTETQWQGRELIESSLAIKCPSIAYHLVGAKKVQQRLVDPGMLEKFIKSPAKQELLRGCFAGLWSMGSDFDPKIRESAMANPEKFVIKPQREGGGNNIYGEEITTALEKMSPQDMAAHILMERIFPPREQAVLVRDGQAMQGKVVSELGIYSVYLGDGTGKKPIVDEQAGYLLRVKFDGVDEGGVASGFSCLSSPWLV